MPILLDPKYDYQVKGDTKIFKGKDLLSSVSGDKTSNYFYFLVSGARDNEGHALGTSVLLRCPLNLLVDLSEHQTDEFLESLILELVEDCQEPEYLHVDDFILGVRNTYYNEVKEPVGLNAEYTYLGNDGGIFVKLIENMRDVYEFESEATTMLVKSNYVIAFSSTD